MSSVDRLLFAIRPTVTLELPLARNTRILHPEQVILKIATWTYDIGAFCYAQRSDKRRARGKPREVVLASFLKQRPVQVRQLIKALSRISADSGNRLPTAQVSANCIKAFLDLADRGGMQDCLAGGEATRRAFRAWEADTVERYRRQDFGAIRHNQRLRCVRALLEAVTGIVDLQSGTAPVRRTHATNSGTDPLSPDDFARFVAIAHAIFNGLADLVLNHAPFPYQLSLPSALGWKESHLWVFPTQLWRLFPNHWASREELGNSHWPYDYANGRLATVSEIAHRYHVGRPSKGVTVATAAIARAQARIDAANKDERDRYRIMLAMIAHNALLFLFYCNTAANESPTREIETDGRIDARTVNQNFRSIKFRAGGKLISLTVPATFMPYLRRFMELRRYLLNGRRYPYLFFTLGVKNAMPPAQITVGSLTSLVTSLLRAIDPTLPYVATRKLRSSVADWYQRHHDASITAKVLQNTEQTVQRRYDAGSATDHKDELSLFLASVSEAARKQRIVDVPNPSSRPLEEGGRCTDFGHPVAMVEHAPVTPDCRDGQGCLFCAHRVLVAGEDDARKLASAAFVMEQVILGPKHEEALRPLIAKCDEDLEKIAVFGNCRAMVDQVRKDVFEGGNLTPFFADKFQLFLELGVVA